MELAVCKSYNSSTYIIENQGKNIFCDFTQFFFQLLLLFWTLNSATYLNIHNSVKKKLNQSSRTLQNTSQQAKNSARLPQTLKSNFFECPLRRRMKNFQKKLILAIEANSVTFLNHIFFPDFCSLYSVHKCLYMRALPIAEFDKVRRIRPFSM